MANGTINAKENGDKTKSKARGQEIHADYTQQVKGHVKLRHNKASTICANIAKKYATEKLAGN